MQLVVKKMRVAEAEKAQKSAQRQERRKERREALFEKKAAASCFLASPPAHQSSLVHHFMVFCLVGLGEPTSVLALRRIEK